jgi:hypothetical protein
MNGIVISVPTKKMMDNAVKAMRRSVETYRWTVDSSHSIGRAS